MWAVECFSKDGIDTDLEDSVHSAGLRFLDAECGALDGITPYCSLGGIDRCRMFAFDGRRTGMLVTEDRTCMFCEEVSSGTYDLGYLFYPAFFFNL